MKDGFPALCLLREDSFGPPGAKRIAGSET